jgi:hypothetical protein
LGLAGGAVAAIGRNERRHQGSFLDAVLEDNPCLVDPNVELVSTLSSRGEHDQALSKIAQYERTCGGLPAELLRVRLLVELRKHDWPRARQSVDSLLQSKPSDADVWLTSSRLFERSGDVARATADRRRAVELDRGILRGRPGVLVSMSRLADEVPVDPKHYDFDATATVRTSTSALEVRVAGKLLTIDRVIVTEDRAVGFWVADLPDRHELKIEIPRGTLARGAVSSAETRMMYVRPGLGDFNIDRDEGHGVARVQLTSFRAGTTCSGEIDAVLSNWSSATQGNREAARRAGMLGTTPDTQPVITAHGAFHATCLAAVIPSQQ